MLRTLDRHPCEGGEISLSKAALAIGMVSFSLVLVLALFTVGTTLPAYTEMEMHSALTARPAFLRLPSSKSSLVDSDAEYVSGIHTIVYNRTFDDKVVSFYHPSSVQFSPGAYVTYTTSNIVQLTLTPEKFFINSFGYDITWGNFTRSDGKLVLTKF
ncbi:hypothetical protein WJX75_008764 [Coccomyxa subellipsoidea]|uniref:Late embryogenesis abundant protein LEA-2 subgroup domain-containing protein n=1 Tax=Coccomyxa subellipsoidea TaxID=248742 RepID=A0ABR2YS70_9CHLO